MPRSARSPAICWATAPSPWPRLANCSSQRRLAAASRPGFKKNTKSREYPMKAAVLHEVNKPLVIDDVSLQKPGPREVLIRTTVAGLCHSDLHFMEGLYPHPLPAVLGPEADS